VLNHNPRVVLFIVELNMSLLGAKKIRANSDGSNLCLVLWRHLSSTEINNWRLNRPHDPSRLPEITYQLDQNDYVDGIIYLVNVGDGKYECFDGIHRIEAMRELSKTKDCNNYRLLICYYPEYNETQIKQKFETLNKCIPVPHIYTKDSQELEKRKTVERLVEIYRERFPEMFKPSTRPQVPHENRDIFTNKIDDLMEQIQVYDTHTICELFDRFNMYMKRKVETRKIKLTKKQRDKCEKYNCFIFASKDWDNRFTKMIKMERINGQSATQRATNISLN
jgi:hypothetical protein